jgi:hypothetical protein
MATLVDPAFSTGSRLTRGSLVTAVVRSSGGNEVRPPILILRPGEKLVRTHPPRELGTTGAGESVSWEVKLSAIDAALSSMLSLDSRRYGFIECGDIIDGELGVSSIIMVLSMSKSSSRRSIDDGKLSTSWMLNEPCVAAGDGADGGWDSIVPGARRLGGRKRRAARIGGRAGARDNCGSGMSAPPVPTRTGRACPPVASACNRPTQRL